MNQIHMINAEFCRDSDLESGTETVPFEAGATIEYIFYNDLIERVMPDVILTRQIPQNLLKPLENLSVAGASSKRFAWRIKSWMDVILSLTGILFLLPFFIVIAILIKANTRGPVFFRQERIGLEGRKFTMYKFRTMVSNAECMLDDLKAYNEATGPVFKIKHDPRITKMGRFLRKTGIDEFPQLINVLKGDMSLVGPRPPLETEVNQYEPWQLKRLSVIPGITCTWQILPKRHDILFEEWVALDLQYIDHWSLSKDIGLLFKTIGAVFLAGGH